METLTIQNQRNYSRAAIWTGRIISWVIILFLLADSIMKLVREPHYVQGTRKFGFTDQIVQPLGLVLLVITILFIIPRTVLVGLVLLTAYLGGAVAVMILQGHSFVFPVIFCSLAWFAVYLQNARLRSLL